MIEIELEGNIPSKKNSRIRTKSGAYIPNKRFYDWQNDAIKQVRSQTRERFFTPVAVDLVITFGRKSKSDLDNRLTSVLDMLVEAMVLRDDRFEYVVDERVRARYVKGKPGAILRISEAEPVL
jgi:Holliday junction resolvase RusA-like endonuclease